MSCKDCKCKTYLRAIVHQKDSSDCYDCERCSYICDNSKYSSKCERYMPCSSLKSKSTKLKINIGVIGHVEHDKTTLTKAVLKIIKEKYWWMDNSES